MMRVAIAAAALAACGRIGFDAHASDAAAATPALLGFTIEYSFMNTRTLIGVVSFDPATGAMVELAPFDLGVVPHWLLPNARATALYVSSRQTASIYTLRLDPTTGALATIGRVDAAPWPFAMTLDAAGRHLYAADEGNARVWGYTVAADDTLVPLAGSPWTYAGTSSDFIAIDPSGRWLYAVDDGTESLYGFAVQSDGTLVVQPTITWATMDSSPHAAVFAGGGSFGFIAPDLSGGIPGFTIDVASGALSTTPGSKFASGANTSEFAAVSASGDVLFLASEGTGSATADVFAIAADGSLAHLPGSPLVLTDFAIGVAASPFGGYAVFSTDIGLAVVRADSTSGAAFASAAAVAAVPRPWQITLARTR